MADNSIVIGVELDDKQAQKELNRLENQIYRLRESVQRASSERMPLVEQAAVLGAQLDAAKAKLEEMQIALEGMYSAEQIASQEETVASLQAQWNAVNREIENYDRQIAKANRDIAYNEERAGELEAQLAGVGENGSAAGNALSESMSRAAERVEHLGNRIAGLIKRVFVFSLITRALRSLRTWLANTVKANAEAAAAVGQLKGALATLAAPIIRIAIPALTTLINAITKVVSAIAAVVSVLFGTTVSASADAAKSLNEEQEALEGVGGAAGDASKQMANFDEINQLTDDKGGGGGGGLGEFGALFDAVSEFKLPDWLNEFLESLRITIKDVFFDWDNLTGEQIAEKCLVGLFAITGGIVGFALGGVPGALVGTLTGLAIGLVISALTFNHDGKLSKNEVFTALGAVLVTALGGLLIGGAAAAVGASVAAGAAIGLAIGATLAISLLAIKWMYEGKVEDRAHESPLGSAVYALLNDSKATLEAAADLRLRIDNVTAEISEEKLSQLEYAEDLIHKIFELDQEDNKTAEQIAVINSLIDELNGMGLEGIQLQFDETTGHVNQTEAAILANLEALKKQYKLEAAHDAIVEQYKNELEAKKQVKDTTDKLKDASDKYNQALGEQQTALEALNEAQEQYAMYFNAQGEEFNAAVEGLAAAKLEYDAATTTVDKAKEAINKLAEALDISLGSYDAAKQSVAELEAEHDNLVKKIAESADGAEKGGKAIMEGEKTGLEEGYQDTEDFLVKAQEELQKAANLANGIESPSTVYAEMGKYIMEGLANGITNNAYLAEDAMRTAINGLITIAERGINNIASSFNGSVGKLNQYSSEMGRTIPTLPTVAIPRLAAGAVIPANHEFLAVLGDQKNGTNIEAPLETIVAAFRQALNESGAGNRQLVLQIGEYEFARLVFDAFNSESGRIGTAMVR